MPIVEVTNAIYRADASDPKTFGVVPSAFGSNLSGEAGFLPLPAVPLFNYSASKLNDLSPLVFSGEHYNIPEVALSNTDLAILVRHETDNFSLFGGSTEYIPIAQQGSTSTEVFRDVGSPSVRVNGTASNWSNRGDAYSAIASGGEWKIVVFSGLDVGTLSTFLIGGTNTGTIFKGDFAEYIFSEPGGFGSIEKVEGYLAHKWGISSSLPGDHPYRNEAPPDPDEAPTNQASKVSGVVQINGAPAAREVRAFSYNPETHFIESQVVSLSKSLGDAISDPQSGEYSIDLLKGYSKEVFVVAFDDYGGDFKADMPVSVGDRVHPTTSNGHVWECTSAGTLPSEEPAWVVDTETAQLYGSASMIAKAFYRPMVHGPVMPEVTIVAPAWTPSDLFSNEEAGAWYDPSDLSTMWQDEAMTIPVEAEGDPIAVLEDKSGNGINAVSRSGQRPTYGTDGTSHWVLFNGTDQIFELQDNLAWMYTEFGFAFMSLTNLNSGFVAPFHNDWVGSQSEGITLLLDSDPGNELFRGSLRQGGARQDVFISPPDDWTSPFLAGIELTDADSKLRVHLGGNSEEISVTKSSNPLTHNFFIGTGLTDGTFALEGRFYGFVAVRKELTPEDKSELKNYYSV